MLVALASASLLLWAGCKANNRYETELEATWACERWEKDAKTVERIKTREIDYTRTENGKEVVYPYYVDQFGEEYPMPTYTYYEKPDGKFASKRVSPYLFRKEPRGCIAQEKSRQILGVMNENVITRFRY